MLLGALSRRPGGNSRRLEGLLGFFARAPGGPGGTRGHDGGCWGAHVYLLFAKYYIDAGRTKESGGTQRGELYTEDVSRWLAAAASGRWW